jgi:dynein heavy chain, axonemal
MHSGMQPLSRVDCLFAAVEDNGMRVVHLMSTAACFPSHRVCFVQVRHAPPPDKKKLEHDFVFACIWAFGGAMFQDKVSDYRKQFSQWWTTEWKAVPFPDKGLVYDYYVRSDEDGNVCMAPWEDIVEPFKYSPAETFGNMFVNTVETTRMRYFLKSFVSNRHYCMFVGNSGTSKTAIMKNLLRHMDAETMSSYVVNMNSFSDAPSLQPTLEAPLEKKSGVRFGPPGAKSMVYFIDDMNMPLVDKYDTQSAIEILRQYVDYGGWYDKVKIVLKDIVNCQLLGCMNPTAGSFQITPRMQRHFVTFGIVVRPSPLCKHTTFLCLYRGPCLTVWRCLHHRL